MDASGVRRLATWPASVDIASATGCPILFANVCRNSRPSCGLVPGSRQLKRIELGRKKEVHVLSRPKFCVCCLMHFNSAHDPSALLSCDTALHKQPTYNNIQYAIQITIHCNPRVPEARFATPVLEDFILRTYTRRVGIGQHLQISHHYSKRTNRRKTGHLCTSSTAEGPSGSVSKSCIKLSKVAVRAGYDWTTKHEALLRESTYSLSPCGNPNNCTARPPRS